MDIISCQYKAPGSLAHEMTTPHRPRALWKSPVFGDDHPLSEAELTEDSPAHQALQCHIDYVSRLSRLEAEPETGSSWLHQLCRDNNADLWRLAVFHGHSGMTGDATLEASDRSVRSLHRCQLTSFTSCHWWYVACVVLMCGVCVWCLR